MKQIFLFDKLEHEKKDVKKCSKCKKVLPLHLFRMRREGYRRSECKECAKEASKLSSKLKAENGSPPDDYECPICLRNYSTLMESSWMKPTKHSKKTPWCLDHDHDTKKFRGWLCNSCNTILGHLNDDPKAFYRAILYLNKGKL